MKQSLPCSQIAVIQFYANETLPQMQREHKKMQLENTLGLCASAVK
ncbi:MAG: hypothetical protein Q8O72_07090 [Bacteroidales bacterium]|nr:hypothetical protein [Bacteroidales bacterium]